MSVDTIIFDLDDTLVLEARNRRGQHGFDDDLEFAELYDGEYYLAVRPFANEVLDIAHELFKNVYLWTWNPNMHEAIPALGWEGKFDRTITYRDFNPRGIRIDPEKCKLVKDLSLVVDDPDSALIIEDTKGIIEQEDRAVRVEPFLGLGNDDALIRAFLDLERFGVRMDKGVRDDLEEARDFVLAERVPKFRTRLDDLTVRAVNGHETAFTPEGLELLDEVGEGILECVGINADKASRIPRQFRGKLISNSDKGKLYLAEIGGFELAFKFYKRKELDRINRILIETGLDQLEAAHFINTQTGYHAPTPYFANIDVLCMEYIPGLVPYGEYGHARFGDKEKGKKAKQREEFFKKAVWHMSRAVSHLDKKHVWTSCENFYIDAEHYEKTGRIRLNPFDQKALHDSENWRDSDFYKRRDYLYQKYGIFEKERREAEKRSKHAQMMRAILNPPIV